MKFNLHTQIRLSSAGKFSSENGHGSGILCLISPQVPKMHNMFLKFPKVQNHRRKLIADVAAPKLWQFKKHKKRKHLAQKAQTDRKNDAALLETTLTLTPLGGPHPTSPQSTTGKNKYTLQNCLSLRVSRSQ